MKLRGRKREERVYKEEGGGMSEDALVGNWLVGGIRESEGSH